MTYVLISLMAVLIFLSMADFVEGVARASAQATTSKRFFKETSGSINQKEK